MARADWLQTAVRQNKIKPDLIVSSMIKLGLVDGCDALTLVKDRVVAQEPVTY